jgi:hypothetical protein
LRNGRTNLSVATLLNSCALFGKYYRNAAPSSAIGWQII